MSSNPRAITPVGVCDRSKVCPNSCRAAPRPVEQLAQQNSLNSKYTQCCIELLEVIGIQEIAKFKIVTDKFVHESEAKMCLISPNATENQSKMNPTILFIILFLRCFKKGEAEHMELPLQSQMHCFIGLKISPRANSGLLYESYHFISNQYIFISKLDLN